MNLHQDQDALSAAILFSSDMLKILPAFIEKDYWITLVLKKLSQSKYNNSVVFKGGTSLSKGHKLISRFSEDIDIAVIEATEMTGNKVKMLMRDIEKSITSEFSEIEDSPISSKGSRFRKSVFSYPKTGETRVYSGISDKLIIEINSFGNPFPYGQCSIECLIFTALKESNQNDLIEKYGLQSFEINVLDKSQTMLEKMVSLLRFSFDKDAVSSISGKIRHFYDLYYLLADADCNAYINDPEFPDRLSTLWTHDQNVFTDPKGWREKSIAESPLITQFPELWTSLKNTYSRELPALAFKEIPAEKLVAKAMIYILNKLSK